MTKHLVNSYISVNKKENAFKLYKEEHKMKWSKKIILTCIALGATISLTACGKNQEDASGKVEIEFFNQKKK